MKLLTFIFLFGVLTSIYGQNLICTSDTFNLTLAYEIGGQFSLDDQIIKSPGFVKFDGHISLEDYKKGYFELPYFESGASQLLSKACKIDINADSLVKYAGARFDSLTTKIWTSINKTFAGKEETMIGTKVDIPPLVFKYKVFQVKFIAVHRMDNKKTFINMDRKNKKEKQLLDINCPQYIITEIIKITAIN